ncbi:hypothetical protein DUI87_04662 [Hirundo rustica rustica]|uniref:SRCR domain-containing protein n=1 Tax=Hirundo rustica rustica TaxID=333673 RepID=A0A3M0L118_HIRRU|nr:hypothetical protein DUI87_04662 [Hirundo rustica rustica]
MARQSGEDPAAPGTSTDVQPRTKPCDSDSLAPQRGQDVLVAAWMRRALPSPYRRLLPADSGESLRFAKAKSNPTPMEMSKCQMTGKFGQDEGKEMATHKKFVMKIKDKHGEDGNSSDMHSFSVSEKIGFASPATTTFQISEPRSQKKASSCCVRTALSIYLLLLTAGQGLLMYKVFKMQKEILKLQEQNASYTEESLESSFAKNLALSRSSTGKSFLVRHEENWRRSLEEEISIIKSNNANLMMRMNNITLVAGVHGPQGEKGSKGAPGPAGPSGGPGVKGEKGEMGLAGPQGLKGDVGKKGDPGPQGPVGPQGQQGQPGQSGYEGSPGKPGPPGPKGEAGAAGQRGPPGSPGLDGRPGQKGEKGDQGPKGSPGAQGIAGLKGEQGEQGTAGIPGPAGQKGTKGDYGTKGLKGEPGPKGAKGDIGLSAGLGNFVRIVGEDNRGRVEIFHQGSWGTICDDGWTTREASVVCRMLGFNRAVAFFTAPPGTGQIWLDDVNCKGTEITITDCNKRDWGAHNCNHSEDVGVECA